MEINSETKVEIIQHIRNGTNVEESMYSLDKILNNCGMGQYRKICESRILYEVGLEEGSIDADLLNGGIILSRSGVLKCKDIIAAFISDNQMNELIEACDLLHESAVANNNCLWLIRDTPTKELKRRIKSKEWKEYGFQELLKQELLARNTFVRLYRFLQKWIEQKYYDVRAAIKYFWKIRYIKRYLRQVAESEKFDYLKVPVKADKSKLFCNYFNRRKALLQKGRNSADNMKFVFAGVKYFNTRKLKYYPKSRYQIEQDYKDMKSIIGAIAKLTPTEFISIFPVDKNFDGDKYRTKDYFYTQEMLKKFEQDMPIGDKCVVGFLEDYTSVEIFRFICRWSGLLSNYSVYCGKSGPFDEYMSDLGNRAKGLELR